MSFNCRFRNVFTLRLHDVHQKGVTSCCPSTHSLPAHRTTVVAEGGIQVRGLLVVLLVIDSLALARAQ